MFVIRLPNGNLLVPHSATGNGQIGQVYVEIGPQDPDFVRLEAQAITQEEADRRKARWRDDDEELRRALVEFARSQPDSPL